MNAAVVYSSKSGNTERVAKAVADKLADQGVSLTYRGRVPQAGSSESPHYYVLVEVAAWIAGQE